MIKLSIIIPIYNAEKYLSRCVNSCLSQGLSNEDYEILLCDDGSVDDSFKIAQQLQSVHNRIRVFTQSNSGAGSARNLGLQNARGLFVMFVDSDDYILPVGLADYIKFAEKNKLDILHFSFKVFRADGSYSICSESQFKEKTNYTGVEVILMDYTIGSVCGAIFSLDFLKRVKILFRDDIIHEDTEFMLRLLPCVDRIMFAHDCLYSYCWNEKSTDRSKSPESYIKSMKSDIIIAKSYMSTADNFRNTSIYKYYYKKANSQVTSLLFSLITNKSISLSNKLQIIEFAKIMNVYPMKKLGTLSFKSTILQFFLNNEKIELGLIRMVN